VRPEPGAQCGDFAIDIVLIRQRDQQLVWALECRVLDGRAYWRRSGATSPIPTSIVQALAIAISTRSTTACRALGEVGGDLHGQGCVKFPHDGQGEIPLVAITIDKGEAGEPPRKVAFDQPLMDLVHKLFPV